MQKPPFQSGVPDPEYERIMIALEAILASERFVAAPQMSAFLRYVVEQAASGNKFRIKAYTVAVDALGKPDSFDPQNDPVVRVLAGRLRSSLAAYYETRPDEDVVIEMKPGSYVPGFVLTEESASADDDDAEEPPFEDDEDMDHSATAANSVISESDLAEDTAPTSGKQQPAAESSVDANPALRPTIEDRPQSHDRDSVYPARGFLRRLPDRYPKATAAAALLLAFLMGLFLHDLNDHGAPDMQAASPTQLSGFEQPPRQRPDSLSLFISAMEPADSLLSQLNTMMSGVFSESEEVRVYRLMRSTQRQRYWPEDYLLSLNVLPMPDETQVSVQLVDAQTGRITHMEILHLSDSASQQLSADELKMIMDCARFLISEKGPLHTDYLNKASS